ncbi:Uncharacterised protein [Vibrio cholerae]|nr:Uncharacterised protein [Vibrio cholerae]
MLRKRCQSKCPSVWGAESATQIAGYVDGVQCRCLDRSQIHLY